MRAILSAMERRAKLLGLDAPTRLEHAGDGGGPLQIEAVRKAVAELPEDAKVALRAATKLLTGPG